jgi:hypothetical protein
MFRGETKRPLYRSEATEGVPSPTLGSSNGALEVEKSSMVAPLASMEFCFSKKMAWSFVKRIIL